MKKIFAACIVFMMLITTSFAQKTTTTTVHKTSHHKYTRHKSHKKHVATRKHAMAMQSQKPSEGATMNARSGSTSNGAGKSAKIQTSTKEKSDNLNDMDKSRN